MKILTTITVVLSVMMMVACGGSDLDYDDFTDHQVTTYFEAETMEGRYILFYYDSTDDADQGIKQELLSFFQAFELLPYYFLDTSSIETESSYFGAYDEEPVVHVILSETISESYIGEERIRTFLDTYGNMELSYDTFSSQTKQDPADAIVPGNGDYLIYYYEEDCADCTTLETDIWEWSFRRYSTDILFIDGSEADLSELPSNLVILTEGAPLLLVMDDGVFHNEYYDTVESIRTYLDDHLDCAIIANDQTLDYADFADHALDSFDDTLTISDNLHFEYYYSPYCSHCNSIKIDVLNFFHRLDDIEYYLINASAATGLPKIDSFRGVPALYVIADNEVVMEIVGSEDIPIFISDYCMGHIDLSEYE